MKARATSVPIRSSTPTTTLLTLRSAIILVVTALSSTTTTALAESGAFELQTNLVSCGGDNSTTNNAGGSTAPVAVCTPPESKLFKNVQVVNGTPQPSSTGVRGRLYDVGNLCTEKISDKIDRAWIAFLDCSGGCSLATKLANLQGSNPQAVLIYNQAACTVNSTPAAPADGSPISAVPTPVGSPAPVASPVAAPVTTNAPVAAPVTTDAPVAAPATPTQPADSNPNGGDKGAEGGEKGEEGKGDGDGARSSDGDGDKNNDEGGNRIDVHSNDDGDNDDGDNDDGDNDDGGNDDGGNDDGGNDDGGNDDGGNDDGGNDDGGNEDGGNDDGDNDAGDGARNDDGDGDKNNDGGNDKNNDGDGNRIDVNNNDDGDNDDKKDDSNDNDENNDNEDDDNQTKGSISGKNNNIIPLKGLVGTPGKEGQESVEPLPQSQSPRPLPIPHPINAKPATAQGRSPPPYPIPHLHVSGSKKHSTANAKRLSTEPQDRRLSPRPRPTPPPLVGQSSVATIAGVGIGGTIEPQGRSPRPRPIPHPHIVGARRATPASSSDIRSHQQQQEQHIVVKMMDSADAYVQFPITVVTAEQVTIDYLLKVLTGPAASAPLPAPLKALKTTVNPNGAASSSSFVNPTTAADNNSGVITDLMVSISPAFGEPTGERKFLSMSKPIFALVVGILSAVVCGVVLLYVVRPLVRRHRRQRGGGSMALVGDNESESRGTPSSQSSGGNGYYRNSTAYIGNNNNSRGHINSRYDDYIQHVSMEAPYSDSYITSTGSTTQPPPMQEVYSENTHPHYQKRDSNSVPTISLSGNNTPYTATVPVASDLAASLNAVEPEDPEYVQKHLELLRNQDHLHLQPQSVPLPDSTVVTPTTATAPVPSVQMKEIQSTGTRSNGGSDYAPTAPAAYSISTPAFVTTTITTATPTTTEPPSGSTSTFENIRAAGALSHHIDVAPEESYHEFLEPAAPQDYTYPTSTSGLTPATSGHRNYNNNADDDEDGRYSVVSSRKGSDLFHSKSKPSLFPISIDTSTFSTTTAAYGAPSSSTATTTYATPSSSLASGGITREGGIATMLYRNQRRSMDNPGGFSPAAQSPFPSLSLSLHPRGNLGTDSNSNVLRAPVSNDFLPTRGSMDSVLASYRNSNRSIDLQTRSQDLMSSSRAFGAPRTSMDGSTPRVSFPDDYRPRLLTIPSSSRLTNATPSIIGETTPRISISNDSSRVSMDSQHRSAKNLGDIQTRFQEIAPASAASRNSFSESTTRASFSEDFPSRPSLDAPRANMNASTFTSATGANGGTSELMSPLRVRSASTASWSRYARRDSSGATAH